MNPYLSDDLHYCDKFGYKSEFERSGIDKLAFDLLSNQDSQVDKKGKIKKI